MNVEKQLQTLDQAILTAMVRQALRSTQGVVRAWHVRPIVPPDAVNNPTSGGVFRIAGQAVDAGTMRTWSLVVKVLKSPAGAVVVGGFVIPREEAEDRTGFSCWGREHQAFASGRLAELPGPLVAPRYFGSLEPDDQSIWLFLEELEDAAASEWSLNDYAQAGRHLGEFNGYYSHAGRVPDAPWLSRGWLRSWLEIAVARLVSQLESAALLRQDPRSPEFSPGQWQHRGPTKNRIAA